MDRASSAGSIPPWCISSSATPETKSKVSEDYRTSCGLVYYLCVSVCTIPAVCVCMCMCVCMCTIPAVCMCVCVCVCLYVCMCVLYQQCVCVCVYVCIIPAVYVCVLYTCSDC